MAGLLLRLRLDPAPPLTPLRTPADSLTINSPIMAESGASFVIDSGVSLRLTNQPEHPLSTFFQGGGAGSVTLGTWRRPPETGQPGRDGIHRR